MRDRDRISFRFAGCKRDDRNTIADDSHDQRWPRLAAVIHADLTTVAPPHLAGAWASGQGIEFLIRYGSPSHRSFIRRTLAGILVAGGEVRDITTEEKATMARLGIQTIIFGKRNQDDMAGVLRDIKAAGYEGAEIGNPTDSAPASQIRDLFEEAGLACAGYHTGYGSFTDLPLLDRTATHMKQVGAAYLMCSGVARQDGGGYRESAETFSKAGAFLKERGITFCYHNHNWEFFDLGGGEKGIHLLTENSDPATVKLCIDVYWVACGGEDPAQFIARYADRAAYFHFKDGTFADQKPLSFTELGRGQVDLKAAVAAARSVNPAWIVTEQDSTDKAPVESARISADYAHTELSI